MICHKSHVVVPSQPSTFIPRTFVSVFLGLLHPLNCHIPGLLIGHSVRSLQMQCTGCNREEAVPISTNCSEYGTGCLPTTHPYHFDSLARHPGDEKMPTTLGGKPPRRPRIGASRADNARSLARSLGRGALSLCPVDSGCLKPSSVVADSFAPLAGSPPRLAPPPQLTCPIVPCS